MSVKPLSQDSLRRHVGYNCRRVYNHITGHYGQLHTVCALKPPEFSVLDLLQYNSQVTPKKLCAAVDIAPPNMVILLDKLSERGLIVRKPNPRDGRSQIVELSAAGKALVQQADAIINAADALALAHLSAQEQAQLNALLQKAYQKNG